MFARVPRLAEDDDKGDIFAPVADLMVGVVFIFIILMIALVLNLQKEETVPKSEYDQMVARVKTLTAENSDLKNQVVHLTAVNERLSDFVRFVRDSNVVRIMSQLASADQSRNQMLEEIRKRLSASGVDVTVNSEAGTLMLPARRLFDVGRADPTPEGRKTILQLGAVMSDVLPCYSDVSRSTGTSCVRAVEASRLNAVYIEGHTDVTPFAMGGGRFTDNWDLSAGRAIEALKILRGQYQPLRDFRNKDGDALIGVSGYADTRPAVHDAPDRRLPDIADKDRRIEVRVIMKTNEELVGSVLDELNGRLRQIDDIVSR
jgi:chemotaxis protein MotB